MKGEYKIQVPAGSYVVTVEKSGYKEVAVKVDVKVSVTTKVDIALKQSVIAICNWISSIGGWKAIKAKDVLTLMTAFIDGKGAFKVTSSDVMGVIAYYIDEQAKGNKLTGCSNP